MTPIPRFIVSISAAVRPLDCFPRSKAGVADGSARVARAHTYGLLAHCGPLAYLSTFVRQM